MNHLGRIAWLEGAYEEAAEWYHQSQDIYEQISDWGGLATSLHGLGDTSLALGDIPAAGRYYRQALDISIEIDWAPMILLLLIVVVLNIVFWWLPFFRLCFPIRSGSP